MASQMSGVLRHLRGCMLARDAGGLTDEQLLECFLVRREEAAFEALVRRHGPMVLGVCRRVLRNLHDAEDAFQATFLVLVRKAASIARRELLGSWLYGVAFRTAREARAAAARRQARERQGGALSRAGRAEEPDCRDLRPVLDAELSRLPEKYRAPVVLCDLESKSRKEAARQLGCPEGTLSSRLARARALLARRLARHGLALSGGALAVALAQQAAAAVPAPLLASTVKAALPQIGGTTAAAGLISARVAALTQGVLQAMWMTRLKFVTVLFLMVGIAGWVLGTLTRQALADAPSAKGKPGSGAKPGGKGGKKEQGPTVQGTIKTLDAAKNILTVLLAAKKKEERTFTLANDVKVYLEEGKKGQEGELADLSPGVGVTLRLSPDQKTVVSLSARGPSITATVKKVDAAKNTITVGYKGEGGFQEKTFNLMKGVSVGLPSAKKGQGGKLEVVKPGASVTLNLSVDKKTVRGISVHRPTVTGAIHLVDTNQNTITINVKQNKGLKEKTYALAKDVPIHLPDAKKGEKAKLFDLSRGMGVALQLSLDGKTVHDITVHRPKLGGTVKSVDAAKNTITVTYKAEGGLKEKTLDLAKDVAITLADTDEGSKPGKLTDLTEDTLVGLQLSLDQKTVHAATVHGSSFTGVLKGVDAGNNTVTVEVKEEGGFVEKTLELTKHAQVSGPDGKPAKLSDLPEGNPVAVRLTIDKEKAVAVNVLKKK
jgi:RNA polymerase sigma factor (sigma-70 family)